MAAPTEDRVIERPSPEGEGRSRDHLRKRRLDLGLLQRDVAGRLGVDNATVTNWELGQAAPALRWLPGIIRFLGYDPRPRPKSIGQALKHYRHGQGLSQQELAVRLRVDPGTLARWERAARTPTGEYLMGAQAILTAM
ncbi:MAG: transcriptional regulator [Gemmatimonadetes bacterium]|nr:transcriptional regulator [Gemmatimonadota bacterium]